MTARRLANSRPASKSRGKTRQKLLDAGLVLFAQKGVEGVTVSELEEAVGLKAGSGSFYRHFPDKGALLEALIEQEIEKAQTRRAREQGALDDPGQDVREALTLQFRLTLRGLRENTALINLLNRAADHFPALISRLRAAFVLDATETVARSYAGRIQRGDMVSADPAVLATLVQSTLFGYFSAEQAFGRPANAEAAETALIDTLVKILIR
ncbi:TetR/AcrR family transcriptional regulator [Alcanivorax sp. 1008]|uniref:TetR/AcrR family transcriptional regulator n=1 Tax=Alcanivorax sp. 1008 TaxID=2816853 RepID=UPI001D80286D|nr:TetR/AcrR family transcriptional regulator [Alcanivorax sp. 1008]MCC1498131.1 TetR/AcrR family transcriptional regulator [Alcanivorax sp. 1008]